MYVAKMRPFMYVAHPYNAETHEERVKNIENAMKWSTQLALTGLVIPIAPWIEITSVIGNTEKDFCLELDVDTVAQCDILILTGGRISPGMKIEQDASTEHGIWCIDATHFGYSSPSVDILREWLRTIGIWCLNA